MSARRAPLPVPDLVVLVDELGNTLALDVAEPKRVE